MPSISWRRRRAIYPGSSAVVPCSISIRTSSDLALLGGLRHLLEIVRIAQVHRSVRLEGVDQAELLAELAHRRHDLLAQQADAGLGVLRADRAVVAPEAINARARLCEHPAQFRND